ncbi:MAG: hypothetical protein CSA53_07045 [Gammaproteobacteria bacterium]|nr:MAG: hypothetical protein CSA53_07045 [Gammaproteobacteria bacterium]
MRIHTCKFANIANTALCHPVATANRGYKLRYRSTALLLVAAEPNLLLFAAIRVADQATPPNSANICNIYISPNPTVDTPHCSKPYQASPIDSDKGLFLSVLFEIFPQRLESPNAEAQSSALNYRVICKFCKPQALPPQV